MKNRWVTYDDPIAGWVADLSSLRNNAPALMEWFQKVLEAGEMQEVFKVRQAPLAKYSWAKDGPLSQFLKRGFDESRVVDLFHFSTSQFRMIDNSRFQVFARMAYVDADEQLVESDVDDLGMLLRSLRPVEYQESPGLFDRCVPLLITGPKIDFNDPQHSIWPGRRDEILVRFRIFSDIWFPWVSGYLEEVFDVDKMYDTRLLAERHTPRLNRFLSSVSTTTKAMGGTWQLDEDDSRTILQFMVSTEGIRLDVEPPQLKSP